MPSHQLSLNFIAVDGPIGSGKTTIAKLLAESMGAQILLEPSENNPFLPDFYRDMRKNAFKTQLYFLLNRYQQQAELKQRDIFNPMIVSDYTFAKDAIFAEINLSEDELAHYNNIFSLLQEKLPKPDLVIYLRADSNVLLQRIKKRGKDYERSIEQRYLEKLTEGYNRYFLNYSATPLLVVDSTNQNYLENPDDFANLTKAITSHRGGTVQLIAR
jgi:deoxyadenosine/deoxycytidine kinase